MTIEFVPSPVEGEAVPNHDTRHDDDTDATPTGIRRVPPRDALLIEKTIKFSIPGSAQRDNIPPERLHLHWIQAMQESYGKSIQIFNNKGSIMPRVDTLRWDIGQHHQHFNTHRQKYQSRQFIHNSAGDKHPTVFIIHRIHTSITLSDIRSNPKVRELILDNGATISEHRWLEDVRDTSQLAFVLGLDPKFYNQTQAHEHLTKALSRKLPQQTKIPKFKMAFCTPQTVHQNVRVRTKAYAVETEKQHSAEMMKLLKEACKDTHEFVPFYMRKKHLEAFCKTIIENTRIMSENRTVVLQNIGLDAMYYLQDRIANINGVHDLQPCPSVIIDGKNKLLVRKGDFNRVRSELMENLHQWYNNHVAEDAKQLASQFPGDPRVAPIASDGYSSSEASYTENSVNTALSYTSDLSDITNNTEFTKQSQASNINSLPKAPNNWASKIRASIKRQDNPFDQIQTNLNDVSIDATYISDLQSRRAELDSMRNQLAELEKEKAAIKEHMTRQAEQHQRELKLQQKEQQLAIQSQADQQRRDFEHQLLTQRQQLEQQARQQRQELEERLSQQIAKALQSRPPPTPPPNVTPTTVMQLPPEFYQMVANQDRQLNYITTLLSRQALETKTTATKRGGSDVINLTMDHYEMENKKQDLKATPQNRNRDRINKVINMVDNIHMAQGLSPSSQITETPYESNARHPSTWEGFHSPSSYQSPQRHEYSDHRSRPDSNLANHPMFRSPGDGIGDDSIQAEKHYLDSAISRNELNDSEFSDHHMADIVNQHHQHDGQQSPNDSAMHPQEKECRIAKSPNPEDKSRGHQATPVGDPQSNNDHEL